MIFFKPNLRYKIQNDEKCLEKIVETFKSGDRHLIKVLKDSLFCDNNPQLDNGDLLLFVNKKFQSEMQNILNQINYIKSFWLKNGDNILESICEFLKFDFFAEFNIIIEFHILPFNYYDFYGNTIYLSCYKQDKENLNEVVSFIIKYFVLYFIRCNKFQNINLTYSYDNKYCIASELVADAIVFNSPIKCYNIYPAYKYFYNMTIGGVNVIDEIRQKFNHNSALNFIIDTIEYVDKNLSAFSCFKNKL